MNTGARAAVRGAEVPAMRYPFLVLFVVAACGGEPERIYSALEVCAASAGDTAPLGGMASAAVCSATERITPEAASCACARFSAIWPDLAERCASIAAIATRLEVRSYCARDGYTGADLAQMTCTVAYNPPPCGTRVWVLVADGEALAIKRAAHSGDTF